MTEIQEKVIPYLLDTDIDLIGLAQTGTGKTAAFGIPLIQKAIVSDSNFASIILCPTRELANKLLQILRTIANIVQLKLLLYMAVRTLKDKLLKSKKVMI